MKFLFILFLIYLFAKMLISVIKSISTEYLSKAAGDVSDKESAKKININPSQIEDADFDEIDD